MALKNTCLAPTGGFLGAEVLRFLPVEARLSTFPARSAHVCHQRRPRLQKLPCVARYSSSGAQARSSPFFKGAAACGLQRVTATWLLWGFQ